MPRDVVPTLRAGSLDTARLRRLFGVGLFLAFDGVAGRGAGEAFLFYVLPEVVEVAAEEVDVDGVVDAGGVAFVGELPDFPMACRGLLAVACNPEVVVVESVAVEVVFVVAFVGVNDGLDAVVALDVSEPFEGHADDFLVVALHDFFGYFEVEDGREVAGFERRVGNEVFCLCFGRDVGVEEMVSTADDAAALGFGEVALELGVADGGAFGAFDEGEEDRLEVAAVLGG